MTYMGSKSRIAKLLLPIILKNRKENQWYVEPFCGGMNMIEHVGGNRVANDSFEPLIALWKGLTDGTFTPPKFVDVELYHKVRTTPKEFDMALVGWVGFCCSYRGKYFGGYAGVFEHGTVKRNYQSEAFRNVTKQVPKIQGTILQNKSYADLEIPSDSIIYCDPPYRDTTGYSNSFNHEEFYKWCIAKSKEGHTVFISEYWMPEEFECIFEVPLVSTLSANGVSGNTKVSVEKLYRVKGTN